MLTVYTGQNRALGGALAKAAGLALAENDGDLFVVVPRQLTLLTERTLIAELALRGSFRLRVLSPARLCNLIFSAAGMPAGTRVDDRGRVMLVRAALRDIADGLSIYRNAVRRRGFAEKCAKQIEAFIQGGVTSDALRECAETERGADRLRLLDLAAIMDAVNARMADRWQDGERELIPARERASEAEFIRGARFFFYGFDMMPSTLIRLMGEIARLTDASLFFALKNDSSAPDYDCYAPMERALERIAEICPIRRVLVDVCDDRPAELVRLSERLYAEGADAYSGSARRVVPILAQDVREECMFAAATARRLAMGGMRFADMQLIVENIDEYRQPLIEAFRLYEVPLFTGVGRAVSRTATAECLISALRICDKGFRTEDVFTLLRTGYTDADADEIDRICNYAVKRGIDGSRWTRPFIRGEAAEIAAMEAIRRRVVQPVTLLMDRLKRAQTLRDQLRAAYGYLEAVNAYGRSCALRQALTERGLCAAADELAQAWNGIIGAMDQLAELMDGARMPIDELTRTISEALEAAAIKPLPQSADAVYAQSGSRMLMQNTRALFVLGLSDHGGADDAALLNGALQARVARATKAYLGPDPQDAARMKRFYLKSALGMAQDYVILSCPLSNSEGAAQRPDPIFTDLKTIFPSLAIRGGHRTSEAVRRLMLNAPAAAESLLSAAVSRAREGITPTAAELSAAAALNRIADRLPDLRGGLRAMLAADENRAAIGTDAARALYGRIQSVSVTRLEGFARCPFAHFVKYGLQPDRVEPFALDNRDAGTFLHDAVYEFLRRYGRGLNEMSPADADARMGEIAEAMLVSLRVGSPMEDSAAARAESRSLCATARRCARVLAEQMRGSRFRAEFLEQDFGREDRDGLRAGDVVLEGRIDRADRWTEGGALRILDFKLGGRSVDLAGIYHGLNLQLPVYLGAAMRRWQSRSGGMYFFPLDEGIVNTQSTDAAAIEKARNADFRMSGLLPEDAELLRANAADISAVFRAQVKTDGTLYANVPCADEINFERLIRHAQRRAEEDVEKIRQGEVGAAPAVFGAMNACTYCVSRSACLFDPRNDAEKIRKLPGMKWTEVFDRIALEDTK